MNADALRGCYAEHHRRLYLVALAVTMNRQLAEDAVHDALARVLSTRREPENLLAYVTRAVRNAAIDIVRRGRAFTGLETESLLAAEPGESCALSPKLLTAALATLRFEERETIWLHIYAGMSFREIAAMRRARLNTVTSWYRRGIDKLRKSLEVEDEQSRGQTAEPHPAGSVG